MEINGREIRFFYSVGAKYEIDNLTEENLLMKAAKTAVITSRAYETAQKFKHPGHEGKPLTLEEVLALDEATFEALIDQMAASYTEGMQTTVEAEGSKKKDEASS